MSAISPLNSHCGHNPWLFPCPETVNRAPEVIPASVVVYLCIPLWWMCDGSADCPQATDEAHCSNDTVTAKCRIGEFPCERDDQYPRCVLSAFVCDGDPDCADGSDERYCSNRDLTRQMEDCLGFTCEDDGRCLPLAFVCDGDGDCGDGSDERACIEETHQRVSTDPDSLNEPETSGSINKSDLQSLGTDSVQQSCEKEQFRCNSGGCVSDGFLCDGVVDCEDGSDEDLEVCFRPTKGLENIL